jgi:hypothetical protein
MALQCWQQRGRPASTALSLVERDVSHMCTGFKETLGTKSTGIIGRQSHNKLMTS